MDKRLLLVEQHLRRGIDSNALIATYLANNKTNPHLSLTGAQLCVNLLRFEPHLVYYPWVTPYVYGFLRRREPSVPIVNAFQEQNAVLHQPEASMVQWADKSDYIFAWGQAYKQQFEKLFSGPEVVLTGNPRFDPYFDPSIAEALYPTRRELAERYGLPLEKDWVLMALDFPQVFSSEGRLEELIDRGDLTKERVKVTRKIYRLLKGWMNRFLSEKRSEPLLIMRPHPGSDLEQIKRDFGGETDTVRYIKGGGLPPWILAADRYMTRASTSVVEAWLADTTTALIHTDMHIGKGIARPHVLEAETSLNSYSEFRNFITGARSEGSLDRHHNFLSSHHQLDGRSAFRTAKNLQEIALQQEGEPKYRGGEVENALEIAKFYTKKFLNQSGLNQWNPFDRPNKEFLSRKGARKKVDLIASNLNVNGQDEGIR